MFHYLSPGYKNFENVWIMMNYVIQWFSKFVESRSDFSFGCLFSRTLPNNIGAICRYACILSDRLYSTKVIRFFFSAMYELRWWPRTSTCYKIRDWILISFMWIVGNSIRAQGRNETKAFEVASVRLHLPQLKPLYLLARLFIRKHDLFFKYELRWYDLREPSCEYEWSLEADKTGDHVHTFAGIYLPFDILTLAIRYTRRTRSKAYVA